MQYASETNDLSGYIRARDKLKQAYNQDPSFTSAIDSLSECELKIGISKVLGGQSSAEAHLKESIRLCDLFETLESPMGRSKAVMQGRQGKARLYLWYHSKKDSKLLDQAIEELQAANDGDPPYWSYPLTNALFERYRLFDDISDLQEAKDRNDQNHSADNRDENHLKQRGRIYLAWAKNFSDREAYDTALKSFRNCLPSEDPEIQSYIGLVLASRGIQFDYIDDLREAVPYLEASLALSDRGESKIGILPKVYRTIAMKIYKREPKEALSMLDKAIAILQEKLSNSELLTNQELSEYHDLIGSTYHDRYKISNLPEDINHATEHLQQAFDLGMADTMFLGRFGHVCLQRGKITDEIENQSGFFEDATKYLELSRSGGNEDASNYSELGEAYLRLYRFRKDRRTLKKALDMFLESFNRGNNTLENLGLIGDCYYRLSYFENSLENLFKALEFKTKAREAGHESKEHFSVVGRINLSLYEKVENQNYFKDGIKFICEARSKDKTWPWPVCQLAEVVERFPQMVQQLKSRGRGEECFFYPDDNIWRFFLDNQSEKLWFEGAKLAARWPEVEQNILGGKSKVYVAEDPHGLISSTYVFKPGDPYQKLTNGGLQRLHEEQERTTKMNQYLEQIGAEKFLVPTSVGIFSLDKTKIYAMRRAIGRNLSDLILYGPYRYCEEAIQDTIRFLALYHAWHIVPQENKEQEVENIRKSILKILIEDVGLPKSLIYKIINRIRPILDIVKQLPLVEKRDAHPDNWIVTNEGKIVLIDLEKPEPQSQFILSELVQLIEDLPYLTWSQEGWQRRAALIRGYLEHYNNFLESKSLSTVLISSELQVATYLSFTILRALWGIGLALRKKNRKEISLSSKLQWEKRKNHYFDLIGAVPPIWTEENISFAAPNWEQLLTLVDELKKELYIFKQGKG